MLHHTSKTRRFGLIVAASLIVPPFVVADGITVVAQDRSVSSMVMNPRCQPTSDSDSTDAVDFGPFNGVSEVDLQCGGAHGRHVASEQSELNRLAILSHGRAGSLAASESMLVIHAIGYDGFEITFSLDEPMDCTLTGEVRAVRDGPNGQGASAGVTLFGPGDIPLILRAAQAPGGGVEQSDVFSVSISLNAGTYRLRASAWAVIDTTVPPSGGGDAEYRFRFDVAARCPTDLNGDQTVDLADLARLLSEFGCTGVGCLADVDESGVTDLADLSLLLSDFGLPCP